LEDEVILPMIRANASNKKIRIWSAGCSSGAEPYSIAMVVAKALENYKGWDVKILATDIDTNMLNHCKTGIYRGDEIKEIPSKYRKYVSVKKGDEGKEDLIMSNTLKNLITFNALNLLEPWPMKSRFDVIFCRNVVIYFDKPTQKNLFNRYAEHINKDGWLYIGHSENLFGVTDKFVLQEKTIYKPT